MRETGDLGQAAEQLLADDGRIAGQACRSAEVVDTLHQIAAAEGPGSQGRKLDLLAGLLARATPLEARYVLRLVTGNLRLGIGTPTILDALARVHAGGRKDRPVLERAYNICCDLGLVAATLARGGLTAVAGDAGAAGQPGAGHARPAAVRGRRDPGQAGRASAPPSTSTTASGSRPTAPPTAQIELFTRGLERISTQFPDVVEAAPHRARPARGDPRGRGGGVRRGGRRAAAVPGGHVPAAQARHRRGGAGRAGGAVLLRPAVRRRRGPDPAALPGAAGPAGRGAHAVGPAPADHGGRGSQPEALDATFEQAVADGCEGLVCKSVGPDAELPGRRPRLAVDQAQAGLPHRAVRHRRPGRGRRVHRPGPPPGHLRRGPAGRLRPGRGAVPHGRPSAAPGSPTPTWPSCRPGWRR